MKALKRIVLINWHYFTFETLELDTINFLTGKNGAGKTTVIDAKFDPATKTLVFETDSFSTYALVYKDVAKTPGTSDSTSIALWMMLLAVGGCAIVLGTKTKKSL